MWEKVDSDPCPWFDVIKAETKVLFKLVAPRFCVEMARIECSICDVPVFLSLPPSEFDSVAATVSSWLDADQRVNHTVKVVEKGHQVEGRLAPGFFLAVIESLIIHHRCWIVHQLITVRRAVEVPPKIVEEQGYIETQCQPFLCAQEHDTEQAVNRIFWEHQPSQ